MIDINWLLISIFLTIVVMRNLPYTKKLSEEIKESKRKIAEAKQTLRLIKEEKKRRNLD